MQYSLVPTHAVMELVASEHTLVMIKAKKRMEYTRFRQRYVAIQLPIKNKKQYTHQQIIGFKAGCNTNSEKFNNHKINLLGDIDSICHPHLKSSYTSLSTQMQLLQEENILDLLDDIHICATGIVTSTKKFPPSFLMHVMQYTDGGASTDEIAM